MEVIWNYFMKKEGFALHKWVLVGKFIGKERKQVKDFKNELN